jgi:hypothetical protein
MRQYLAAILLASLCLPAFARPELENARSALQNARSNHSISSIRNHTTLQNAHSQQSLVMQSHIRSSAISRINTAQNNQMASCCLSINPSNSFKAVKTSPDFVSPTVSLVSPKDFTSNTQGLLFIKNNFEVAPAHLTQVDGSKLGRGMFRGGDASQLPPPGEFR